MSLPWTLSCCIDVGGVDDVADYRDVGPKIGTLADFDAMSTAFKAAGIKLILDSCRIIRVRIMSGSNRLSRRRRVPTRETGPSSVTVTAQPVLYSVCTARPKGWIANSVTR